MRINFVSYQRVKITIEKAEQVEVTEPAPGVKEISISKENPFSRDCAFLAVSLIIRNISNLSSYNYALNSYKL